MSMPLFLNLGTSQVIVSFTAGNKSVNQTSGHDSTSNVNYKVTSSDSSGIFNASNDRRTALAHQQNQHAGFF